RELQRFLRHCQRGGVLYVPYAERVPVQGVGLFPCIGDFPDDLFYFRCCFQEFRLTLSKIKFRGEEQNITGVSLLRAY
ncbi:MAG TPA: hypothetical protein VFU15_03260, partial [Bacteroidia bacterium]|nr:hypothetical protein [Bacteroidia bacterium]